MSDRLVTLRRSAPKPGSAEDFTSRHVLSFSIGVLLAANAIRDAYMLIDGPDCVYMKTQYLQGNHDYLAWLTSVSGHHKVSHTGLDVSVHVARSREDDIASRIVGLATEKEVGCVLVSSLPAAAVLAIDYPRLCARAQQVAKHPIVHVGCKSLSKDWIGGYEETLLAIAKAIDLEGAEPKRDNVALVGMLHDRNEEDCRGNVRELRRLLAGLGLEVGSVWLDGGDYADLGSVRDASAIVSLPYGRRAAAALARRLKVPLVQTDLPFGLPATEAWVQTLGNAFDREQRAQRLIEEELGKVIPKLEWVIPLVFQGRKFAYIGDPHLLGGFVDSIEALGAKTSCAVVTNFAYQLDEKRIEGRVEHVVAEGRCATLQMELPDLLTSIGVDCVVANGLGLPFLTPSRYAIVELGFPSNVTHALFDRPYLGFSGFLAFVDRIANSVRMFESMKDRLAPAPRP